MRLDELNTLLAYNFWANERVLVAAKALPEPKLVEAVPGLSFGNVLGTLTHVYNAEYVWRKRYQEGVAVPSIPSDFFPGLEALGTAWLENTREVTAFFAAMTGDELDRKVIHGGGARSTPLSQIVLHVINHGTQFRGEAAVALTAFGHSPGDLDLIFFLRPRS